MIATVDLENFKCFRSQMVPLGDLTVLSGLNGMGKSTVLQALLLLRQSFQQGLLPDKSLALNGDLVRLGTARDVLHEDAEEDFFMLGIGFRDGIAASWRFRYDRDAEVLDLLSGTLTPRIFESSLFGDNFQYLNAERLGPRTSFELSDYQVRHHRQLGSKGEYTAHFLSLFGEECTTHEPLVHPDATSSTLLHQAEAWLGEVSPGIRIHLDLYSVSGGMDVATLRYSFLKGRQTSDKYRSTNVGFGITYTLPILVAVLSARPGTLLLLENPEAHLHPHGQAKMGEFLALAASCGIQVIIETHSDHILNGIRVAVCQGKLSSEQVRLHHFQLFENPDGHMSHEVMSPHLDKDGRIEPWPTGFFDEWERSLGILLGGGA